MSDLAALLSRVAMFTDPNATARSDKFADAFYRETGVMAPGKSVALEMAASQPPDDARIAAYREWLANTLTQLHADITKAIADLEVKR